VRLSPVSLAPYEPHANSEDDKTNKCRYLQEEVYCIHVFGAIGVHTNFRLALLSRKLTWF
jgi:hypothetical protein